MKMNGDFYKVIQMGSILSVIVVLLLSVLGNKSRNDDVNGAEDGGAAVANLGMINSASLCMGKGSMLIGTWVNSAATQTNTFSACEVTVSQSNGCTAIFAYQARGVILENTLLAVSPSTCGTVGSVGHHTYSISGNTLTIDATVFTKQAGRDRKSESI